jgi:signal transduction histidine kinase
MRIILILVLLSAFVTVFDIAAQDEKILSKKEFNTLRSEVLKINATSPIAAIARVDEIFLEYEESLNTRQTLRLLYAKALYQVIIDAPEDAYATLTQCKKLADRLNEPYLTYFYYSYMGRNFSSLEMYELSLENYLEGYQIGLDIENGSLIHQSENNIGHVLLQLYNLDEAREYFEKFYQYGLATNSNNYIATGLNNIGEVLFEQGETLQALDKFTQSLAIRTKNNYTIASSWSHHNLGKTYFQLKDLKQATIHLNQAIRIREEYDSTIEALKSKIILAKVYLAQDKSQQAINLLTLVIEVANEYNNYTTYSLAYEVLNHYYKKIGDLAKALDASENFNAAKLKMAQRQSGLSLNHYIAKSNLALKEIDIIELKKENEMAREREKLAKDRVFILLISALIIIITILLFLTKIKNKNYQLNKTISKLTETQKELIEADKMSAMTTLVSGMAHQLNTPLGIIVTANSFMKDKVELLEQKLLTKNLGINSFKAFIEDAKKTIELSERSSVKASDLVHQFKMISTELEGSKLTSFQLKQFTDKKLSLLANQYQQKLVYQIEGDDVEIFNYPDVLFKVLEQLVKNTFDHQYESNGEIKSSITITSTRNGVDIIYLDNGPGIDEELRDKIFNPFFTTKGMQQSLGLGLNVAYNSVLHLMQGKFSCEASTTGAKFIISLPLKIET